MNVKDVNAGESWTRQITVYGDDDETTREDLTGATGTIRVFDRPGGEPVFNGALEITDADQGELTVSVANTQTALHADKVLYWQVRLNLSGSRVADVDTGKLVIRS